jgi:hypothetical protein
VLFLYQPRQTWMPYSVPANRMRQMEYNRALHQRYMATRRVDPSAERDPEADLERLTELHDAGVLTDAELEAAKAKFEA